MTSNKYILPFVVLVMFLVCKPALAIPKKAIKIGEDKRSYYLYQPKKMQAGKKYPLVIVLHGGGQSGKDMINFTGFNKKANKDSALVVYPNGFENHWNDGRKVAGADVSKEKNDVLFISTLIDELIKNNQADPERVYISGLANGAMMCYRLACEISEKITAIAPVLGALPSDIKATCKPSRVVNIIAFNGADDAVVPYAGGDVAFGGLLLGKVESVNETMNYFANYGSDIPSTPLKVKKKDMDRTDGTTIITETYTNNKFETEIVLYNIKGGGHAWPGAKQFFPPSITGNVSREINASDLIWSFFMNVY
jgi:polyhydroxybutyrate depolymerase